MAGHGSPPPENKANHPGRQVGRPAPKLKTADPELVRLLQSEEDYKKSARGIAPTSRYNTAASPAVNRAAAEADEAHRRSVNTRLA